MSRRKQQKPMHHMTGDVQFGQAIADNECENNNNNNNNNTGFPDRNLVPEVPRERKRKLSVSVSGDSELYSQCPLTQDDKAAQNEKVTFPNSSIELSSHIHSFHIQVKPADSHQSQQPPRAEEGNESQNLQIQDLTNNFNHIDDDDLKMTRRKSNNVVRHNGGIGSGGVVGNVSFPASSHPVETLESGEDVINRPDYPNRDDRENSHEDHQKDDHSMAAFRLHMEAAKERNPEANLVMDLSSRDEENEHQQSDPRDLMANASASINHASNTNGPPAANDGLPMDDPEIDDAGIYGDMAEGDMVAAMLEEAQIPRSQFLGLNAEEKQKLLEARRTCKFCGKVCIKRSDLQRHLLVHTGERPWLCKLCNKSFKAKRSLLYHQRSAHGLDVSDVNGETETKAPPLTSLPIEFPGHKVGQENLQLPRDLGQQHLQQHHSSSTHEAFPSATLHPQLWANLTKLGWPMNVKQETKPLKMDGDQGLDLSASGGSLKPNGSASPGASSTPGTMESLIRHQREQLLARASLSSDPAANLDPNSAAAAFAIAAVAAAAAQQQSNNPLQQAGASHLSAASSMPYPTSSGNLSYFQSHLKPKINEPEIAQAKKRQRVASPEPVAPKETTVVTPGESLLSTNRQLETSYPSLKGHTLTITQPSNANAKFKINIQSESVVATKLEGLNVQTGAKTALYRCHICGKIVGFLSKLQSHLSLHYDRSNPVQMFACYICDEKFKYRQDLVDHVMEHQQNKGDAADQPPPLLASPVASHGSISKPQLLSQDPTPMDPYIRNAIPSPPPLQHFPYQRPEESMVNSVPPIQASSSASSPESINQLSPRGLTSALVQVQPLLPSSSGLPPAPTPSYLSSMPPSPLSMSLPLFPIHSPGTPSTTSSSGYPKKCRFCDKVFEKGYSLQRHERIHTGFKPCYCEECGRGFSEPRNLRHHILRYHSDDAAKQLEMLRRAHRSRNGTLPFGTNKEQQLALMQQQTKDSPTKDRLSLPPSLGVGGANGDDSFTASDNDQIPEFVPPSSSAMNFTAVAPLDGRGEGPDDMDRTKESAAMEVNMEDDDRRSNMEDDDRRSHMDLMAENNPLDDDEDEEVYVDDDDRKPRAEKPSEIAQIASAFLEPEDLERMGVEEKDGVADNNRSQGAFSGGQSKPGVDHVNNQGALSSPTPGSPCPEDLPSQPHYPQSTNAPLVRNGEDNHHRGDQNDRTSPHGDEASNGSSCSKRSFLIPDAEALSPSDPLRHAGFTEDDSFDGAHSGALIMSQADLDPNDQMLDPKSRILSKTNPRLSVVEPGIDRSAICKPRYVNGKAIYSCVFCDKEFCSYSDINRHLNFHEDLRPFKCKYCEYQSRTNSQLKVHMMRHQGIREFGCRICNYSGVTQSDVNRHKKSQQHLLKSQNVCVYCGLGFFKPILLQQHLVSDHPNGAVQPLNHSAYGEQLELE